MTCDQLDSEHWRLSFSEPEAGFIIGVLAQLGAHYREDVAKLPPAQRAYWQGSISRGTGGADPEALKESQEVVSEARAELRSERLLLVENWLRDYELAESRDPWQVEVTAADRDEFVSMLNDRRLLLALELGVTEADMEANPAEITEQRRRHAILEIDILGHFILVTLGPQIYRP